VASPTYIPKRAAIFLSGIDPSWEWAVLPTAESIPLVDADTVEAANVVDIRDPIFETDESNIVEDVRMAFLESLPKTSPEINAKQVLTSANRIRFTCATNGIAQLNKCSSSKHPRWFVLQLRIT
jgi:hypothetical protein